MAYITSRELLRRVAEKTGSSEYMVNKIMSTLTDEIASSLDEDTDVKIRGIGTVTVKIMKPRRLYSPAEGKMVTIPERKNVVIKPSKTIERSLS
jgi:nucleoid DNA-binding protein